MTEHWRELLYPLGFLSTLAFGARVIVQWLQSEAKGKSVVMPLFWKLSLAGNLALLTHAFIQMQFHVCLIQTCNAIISWRNLNLMQPHEKQITTLKTIFLLIASIGVTTAAFLMQGYFLFEPIEWFRIPVMPWQANTAKHVSFAWHMIGIVGLILFGSRFWLQWWLAEKTKTSYLGRGFWWCSLAGESLCLLYFIRIGDPVNFLGPAFGLIPYLRNLMLITKHQKALSEKC